MKILEDHIINEPSERYLQVFSDNKKFITSLEKTFSIIFF